MLNVLMYNIPFIFFLINLYHSSFKHVFSIRVENSADPEQMPASETIKSVYTVCFAFLTKGQANSGTAVEFTVIVDTWQ